ncbi:unnamed protein product [Ectocarpus fasciculatus]
MTITLVGSSRELKNRSSSFLPPIDLLELLVDGDGPATAKPLGAARGKTLPARKARAVVVESPRSLATGDGFAEDMDPFMALMRSRQPTCVEIQEPSQKPALAGAKTAAATVTAVSVAEDATIAVQNVGEESGTACREHDADALPPTPRLAAIGENNITAVATEEGEEEVAVPATTTDPAEHALDRNGLGRRQSASRCDPVRADGGSGSVHHAPRHPASPPAGPQLAPKPGHTWKPSTAGGHGTGRTSRKARGKSAAIPTSSGDFADSLLRLCPALEARISDLRRDNTAAARFLSKAQVTAWEKARRPVGALVSRNRAVCALEGAELSLLRREETATRAQRKREANRERRRRLERRRLATAEATRIKHEGPSLAEVRALEEAALLEKRRRFFMFAVVAIHSAIRWRNDWKERKWKMAKFAEALAGLTEEKESQDVFEASVARVQRFIRRRQGVPGAAGGAAAANSSGRRNFIRCLKAWIPRAHGTWKRRRREGGVIIYDFLKDARLSQNIKAIYRFRRKVMRCQVYVKGVSVVTRDRLLLLGLFFSRCEGRLRGRLAERVRQQVQEEAAADLEVHRQLMRPSTTAAAAAAAAAAATASSANPAAGGSRWKRRTNKNGGDAGGDDDGVSELMEAVAALRLKSAQEELETRSALPDVKHRLLEGLLMKASASYNVRAAHQSRIQLSSGGRGEDGGGGGAGDARKGRGPGRNRRGVSLPEVLFTVDDARELLTRSPPPWEGSASAGDITAGGGLTKGNQASPNGSGELPDAPYSTVAAVSRPGTGGGGGGSKSDFLPNTRVPPMLLLKGVPEAVMCQLVLTAWEQSCSSGRR